MNTENAERKDYAAIAQHLFNSYATYQSESTISNILATIKGIPDCNVQDYRSSRQLLNDFVLRYYPNETVIKANFVNNVLLKQGHSNITVFEFPVGNSRVDLCKINGCSSAFEIKTDLDTFSRLEGQLIDYADVFERVYVITSDKRWKALPDYVSKEFGIYSYHQNSHGRYSFKLRRTPASDKTLDPEKQLRSLPKSLIATEFGLNTSISKSAMINNCLNASSSDEINRFFKRSIKAMYGKRWNYLKSLAQDICELDYEWFFHNNLDPAIIY